MPKSILLPMAWEIGKNQTSIKREDYSWCCLDIGCELLRTFYRVGIAVLWRIFSLDSRTLNQNSIAAA
jgi:hypothetical protein